MFPSFFVYLIIGINLFGIMLQVKGACGQFFPDTYLMAIREILGTNENWKALLRLGIYT